MKGRMVAAVIDGEAAILMERLGVLLAASAEAAVVEEVVFRGLLLVLCLHVARERGAKRPAFAAAMGSSFVFGLMHVVSSPLPPDVSGLVLAQAALKVVQGTSFGLLMAMLAMRSPRFWQPGPRRYLALGVPIAAHFAFDMAYLAPAVMTTGALPATYLTGNPQDVPLLLVTTVLLFAAAVPCARALMLGWPHEQK